VAGRKQDLLQGTLDMLILQTLALGPMHGWGISQRILQISRDVLRVNQGSLYPALHRLEQAGWTTPSGTPRTTTARPSSTS
jgi:PadR family transcriptional regulator, regulatory protein PadR